MMKSDTKGKAQVPNPATDECRLTEHDVHLPFSQRLKQEENSSQGWDHNLKLAEKFHTKYVASNDG